MKWDVHLMPDQSGKVALVTGGNTGLGYQSVQELARKGASVVIACRTLSKGYKTASELKDYLGEHTRVDVMQLDLADYDSIRSFAADFKQKYERLDILMNNAGIVNQIEKGSTLDGSEAQMGTNHFGHFLLTGLLLEPLMATAGARVVTMSSGGYKRADINFEDLDWELRPYHRVQSYCDSKLANLLFTLKLQQYFDKHKVDTIALSAHPGLSASPRQQSIGIGGRLSKFMASPLSRGSRPQLMAATAPIAKALDYFGPKFGIDGPPVKTRIRHKQYTQEVADKLWKVSEQRTRFKY